MVIQGAYLYLGIVWRGLAGEVFPPGTTEAHSRQFLTLRLIQAAVWITTIVLFLTWVRRVQRRAEALTGPETGGSRCGTLAAFLVPGLNLVGPVRLMSVLGHATGTRPPARQSRVPWWIGWWWALVLAAALAHGLTTGLAADWSRPLDLDGPMQLLVLAELLEIAAGVLAILLIRRITGHQEDLRRALR